MQNTLNLLPLAAALCLFIALVEAWIMTLIRYLKMESLRKVFRNYRDLVRSHIDYLMMAALTGAIYWIVQSLQITLPDLIIWLIFIGALYNPFGFVLQAIKPDLADGGYLSKVGIVLGFMPLTIGMGWTSVVIMQAVIENF